MDPLFSGNYFSAKLLFCLFSVMLKVQCLHQKRKEVPAMKPVNLSDM